MAVCAGKFTAENNGTSIFLADFNTMKIIDNTVIINRIVDSAGVVSIIYLVLLLLMLRVFNSVSETATMSLAYQASLTHFSKNSD